jgi:hypothetical protein
VFNSTEIGLKITDEKRWTAGRDYDSRVVRLLRYLNVAGWCRYVVYIQIEQHRGDNSTLGYTSPHDTTRVDVADWKDKLSIRTPQATSVRIATCFNKHNVEMFFANLCKVYGEYNFRC